MFFLGESQGMGEPGGQLERVRQGARNGGNEKGETTEGSLS